MLALLLALAVEDPIVVPSRIQEVTLYESSALVRRSATLPRGGAFVIQGLPQAIDRENVRVRCGGGDVVNVEVRERVVDAVPSARLQEMREKLRAAQREGEVLQDGINVLRSIDAHLRDLMNVS